MNRLHPRIGDLEPSQEALATMIAGALRYPETRYAVYQNVAFDSSNRGHLKFLAIGPNNTLKEAPERLPDMQGQINWAYYHIGWVNLLTGLIETEET